MPFDETINRLDVAKKRISELKFVWVETSQTEEQREKKKETYSRTRNNYKRSDICVTEIPEEERNKVEEIFELRMAENVPKLMTHTKPQI